MLYICHSKFHLPYYASFGYIGCPMLLHLHGRFVCESKHFFFSLQIILVISCFKSFIGSFLNTIDYEEVR